VADSILSPAQRDVLEQFFSTPVGQRFFLTGGTALAEYYLQHRLSDDLDLFTTDDEALALARHEIHGIAARLAATVTSVLSTPTLQRLELAAPGGPPIKLDLARDVDQQFGQHLRAGRVVVDSLDNIGANKVAAIFGRTDAKDFVDLYFLLQAGQDFRTLVEYAKQKDSGLTEFWLAGMLRQAQRLTRLPIMLKPIDLDPLKSFYLELADHLLRQIRPPE
jgi:predicted nucleotidyltransferase component of viral defense system